MDVRSPSEGRGEVPQGAPLVNRYGLKSGAPEVPSAGREAREAAELPPCALVRSWAVLEVEWRGDRRPSCTAAARPSARATVWPYAASSSAASPSTSRSWRGGGAR